MFRTIIAASIAAIIATGAQAEPFGECVADKFEDMFADIDAPLSDYQSLAVQIVGTDFGSQTRDELSDGVSIDEVDARLTETNPLGLFLFRSCKDNLIESTSLKDQVLELMPPTNG